jgi:hypothetical protein
MPLQAATPSSTNSTSNDGDEYSKKVNFLNSHHGHPILQFHHAQTPCFPFHSHHRPATATELPEPNSTRTNFPSSLVRCHTRTAEARNKYILLLLLLLLRDPTLAHHVRHPSKKKEDDAAMP